MRALLLIFCLADFAGCSILLPPTPQATTPERSCAPLHPGRFQIPTEELTGDTHGEHLSLSPQSLEVANVMNAVPLLTQLMALEKAGDIHNTTYMELRQS